MYVVNGTVGFVIVAVGCETVGTFNVGVYKCQIDVIFYLRIELSEALNKSIGMTIV